MAKRYIRAIVIAVLVLLAAIPCMAVTQQAFITAIMRINPLSITLSAPRYATIGDRFRVTAEVENRGEIEVNNASVAIFLPKGLRLQSKQPQVYALGKLTPHKTKKITWSVSAQEAGDYVIAVNAQGYDGIDNVQYSIDTTALISVSASTSLASRIYNSLLNLVW